MRFCVIFCLGLLFVFFSATAAVRGVLKNGILIFFPTSFDCRGLS